MSSPLCNLTACRANVEWINVWAHYVRNGMRRHPTFKYQVAFSETNWRELPLMLRLPVQNWYWRVWVRERPAGIKRVTMRRTALHPQEDATLLFDDAYALWFTYVRML